MKKQNALIKDRNYSNERALYHLKDTDLVNCTFSGQEDGESALKETRRVNVSDSIFDLRYPFWHAKNFSIENSAFNKTARASLWYDTLGTLNNVKVSSVKCLRECSKVKITNSEFDSEEFGWKCRHIEMDNSSVTSPYVFLDSKDIKLNKFTLNGKYSFQYIKGLEITNSNLDTKDAFWHSKNVVIRDSIIKGEYLAWFASDITFINCTIIGIQPFCYCRNLKLINCTMKEANFAFEYSDVQADIKGHVDSIKNPKSGLITVDSVGEVIMTKDRAYNCRGKVVIRTK